MRITGTRPGQACNGMPEPKPYRWRGKPIPTPEPTPRRPSTWIPGARQERLEALASMRISLNPGISSERLPYGMITQARAAEMFGVSLRTITRDLRDLRETAGAS